MSGIVFASGVIFLVVFSCLCLGSVNVIPVSIVESVTGILALSWFLQMAKNKRLSFVRIPFLLPLACFVAFSSLQLLPLPSPLLNIISPRTSYLYELCIPESARNAFFSLSIYPDATFAELLRVISYALVFLMVVNQLKSRREIDILVNVIIVFGLLISIYALSKKFLALGGAQDAKATAGYGPFVNRNSFSGYINLIIPLTVGYFLTDIQLSRRVFYGFCIAMMSLALFWSLSRGGILVYLSGLVFIISLGIFKKTLRRKMLLMGLWVLITLGICFVFLEFKIVWQRLMTLFQKETFVVLGHGYSWWDILKIWKDFPIFGTGLATFGSISAMYKSTVLQGLFLYAHNDYLQLLSETGLTGTLLFTVFFIWFYKHSLTVWFKRHNHYVICLMLGGLSSIFGMLVYSFLDFNLHIPASALLFFVIMGIVFRLSELKTEHAESGELA